MTDEPAENPYVGPRPFQIRESHLFFGRDREVREILPMLIAERLVLFYAQSGAGKSSLINARLIPELRKRNFSVLPVGRVSGYEASEVRPDNVFVFNLLRSLSRGKGDLGELAKLTLPKYMSRLSLTETEELGEAEQAVPVLAGMASPTPIDAPPIIRGVLRPLALIIDQFEEIFTTHLESWGDRQPFFEQLRRAMIADPYLWVVLSIREDHLAELDPYAHLLTGHMRARYYMQPMEAGAALEAVMNPVRAIRPFDDLAAVELVRNMSQINLGKDPISGEPDYKEGQFVEPVQLQVVCYQLWEQIKGQPGDRITLDDILTMSGNQGLAFFVDHALGIFYERAIEKVAADPELKVSERELRDWVSEKLITEKETRASVRYGQEQTEGLPNAVVDRLEKEFIIRKEAHGENRWCELSHDRFISSILQSNREWSKNNPREIMAAATAWRDSGRKREKLWDGKQLEKAAGELERSPESLNELEREFIRESQSYATQQKNRRLRFFLFLSLIAIFGLAALSVFASFQYAQAQTREVDANHQRATAVSARIEAEGLRLMADANKEQAIKQQLAAQAASTQAVQQQHTAEAAGVQESLQRQTAVAASTEAGQERDKAEAARKRVNASELSFLSAYYSNSQTDLSILLAIEAINQFDNYGSRKLLLDGLRSILVDRATIDDQARFTLDFTLVGYPSKITFSPDGALLAAGYANGQVRLWNLKEHKLDSRQLPLALQANQSQPVITGLSFDTQSETLAVGTGGGQIYFWKLNEKVVTRQSFFQYSPLQPKLPQILDLAFQPYGNKVAIITGPWKEEKGGIFLVDYQAKLISGAYTCEEYQCVKLAWSPNGEKLAAGDPRGRVLMFSARGGLSAPQILPTYNKGKITGLGWFPDNRRLISVGQESDIILWDTGTNSILNRITGEKSQALDAALSSDGKYLLLGNGYSETGTPPVTLWYAETLRPSSSHIIGHTNNISSVAFSPLRSVFATAGYDNKLLLWNFEPARLLMTIKDPIKANQVQSAALDDKSQVVAAQAAQPDNSGTWSMLSAGGTAPASLPGAHTALAFTQIQGKAAVLVGNANGTVETLSLADRKPLGDSIPLSNQPVHLLAASPDGGKIAAVTCDGGDTSCNNLVLWNTGTGQGQMYGPILGEKNFPTITSLAFDLDGRRLALGASGSIYFQDLDQDTLGLKKVVLQDERLQNTDTPVTSMAFGPAELRLFASGSGDGTIALWDADSYNLIGTFNERMGKAVRGLMFRRDPTSNLWKLISVSENGDVWEWEVDIREWTRLGCTIAQRTLTTDEKARFLHDEAAKDICSQQ